MEMQVTSHFIFIFRKEIKKVAFNIKNKYDDFVNQKYEEESTFNKILFNFIGGNKKFLRNRKEKILSSEDYEFADNLISNYINMLIFFNNYKEVAIENSYIQVTLNDDEVRSLFKISRFLNFDLNQLDLNKEIETKNFILIE